MEVGRRDRILGSSSTCSLSSSLWRRIWKLNIPQFVVLFLWRACNEILPTRSNLFKKKIISDPLCPMCGLATETSSHILWGCESTWPVWSNCGGSFQKSIVVADDFINIFGYLCDRLSKEELELFAIIAHKLWLRRNKVVFEGLVLTPSCLIKGAREMLEEFHGSQVAGVIPVNGN